MELRDIFTEYCGHLKENFYPVEDPTKADKSLTTSDIMQEITSHYGELGDDDHPVDVSILVETLKTCGFTFRMMPGTTEMRWLLAVKH